MNKNFVQLIGRVTKDPQLKSTPSGQSVCSFSIATNQVWKGNNGEKKEKTDFHNIVFWGSRAEAIAKYIVKGQELLVEGRIETRKWEDKDQRTHYATEIIGQDFQFGQKPKGQENAPAQQTVSDLEREAELPSVELDAPMPEEPGEETLPF